MAADPATAPSAPVRRSPVRWDTAPRSRALAPDLARGFMLLLIAVANVSVYLWGHDGLDTTLHPIDGGPFDRVLAVVAIVFVDARIYPMFAFLFGYGIVQFATSRLRRGVPETSVRRMLRRRHWWMIAFGGVHALLLFSGDILGAYGIAGLALAWMFFRCTDRALRITGWIMLGLLAAFTVFTTAASLLVGILSPDAIDAMTASDDGMGVGFGFVGIADLMTGEPNYWLAMLIRIGLWAPSSIMTVLAISVPLSLLLGGLAARHRWLEVDGLRPRLGLAAAVGITVGALGGVPQALLYLDLLPFSEFAWSGLSLVAQVTGVAGGIGYAALFALIGIRQRERASAPVRIIAAVGKRSLSFYLLQSVIFAPLLAAWGLGLGQRIGTTAAFGIAAGVWLLSLLLAWLLERRGARGPAEVLLRRLTYGKDDPR